MGKLHDDAVKKTGEDLQELGFSCSTNQRLGRRRPDLKCVSGKEPVYVEVKTLKDLDSDHTRQQVADIKKEADKEPSPAVVRVAEVGCFAAINDLGQAFVEEHGLKTCNCAVPKSDANELVQCLSDQLLRLLNNAGKAS